jgi:hypothetical protein
MRTHIWQQFSSNHSASFVLVGQFETEQLAENVKGEIAAIVREVQDWWSQHKESEWHAIENELRRTHRSTPPEQAAKQRYGLNLWAIPTNFLDWVRHDEALKGVFRLGTLVFVQSAGETWQPPNPFNDIMEKLGGRVVQDIEGDDTQIVLNLRMTAPDEQTAKALYTYIVEDEELEEFLEFQMVPIQFPGVPLFTAVLRYEEPIFFIERIHISNDFYTLRPSERADSASFVDLFSQLLTFLQARGMSALEYQIAKIPHE